MENSEEMKNQYMVEFQVPVPLTEELLSMIPDQRKAINELFIEGKLVSYSLAMDRSKVYAIFLAQGEDELIRAVNLLPLTVFMDYDFHELMFHNTIHLIPTMSLN